MSLAEGRSRRAVHAANRGLRSAAPQRVMFPRMRTAWALLLAAGTAHADATVPKPDRGGASEGAGKKTPCPKPQNPRDGSIRLQKPGGPAIPRRGAPPDDDPFIIHAHGPEEPCKPRGA